MSRATAAVRTFGVVVKMQDPRPFPHPLNQPAEEEVGSMPALNGAPQRILCTRSLAAHPLMGLLVHGVNLLS